MCQKIPYPDEATARETARGFARQKKQHFRPYLCYCGAWHLTTVERSNPRRKTRRQVKQDSKYPWKYVPPLKDMERFKKKKRKR